MKQSVILPAFSECFEKFKGTFPNLSEEEMKRLFTPHSIKFYKKGSIIYEEGHRIKGCYFVYNGILKIYQTGHEGKEQIIKFEQAGDLFGFRSVIRHELACTSVAALSDCVLWYLPDTVILDLIKNNREFSYTIMQIACKELGESNRYLKDIALKSVKERLAEILLMIAEDFGCEHDGSLKLSITREDLSNIVGTATETLIRLLSEFKNEGLIESKGRKIKLLDQEKLKSIAHN